MPYSAPSKGFSLIEMMVVISLIGFLLIAATIKIADSRKNQQLKKAQMQLKLGLEQAKNDAFYGKKPTTCSSGQFGGYKFALVAGTPQKYQLTAECGSTDITLTPINFDTDITVTGPADPILFKSVTGGTDLSVGTSVTFTLTLGGRQRTVSVNSSGGINASD